MQRCGDRASRHLSAPFMTVETHILNYDLVSFAEASPELLAGFWPMGTTMVNLSFCSLF
jgi:hypothetical protein